MQIRAAVLQRFGEACGLQRFYEESPSLIRLERNSGALRDLPFFICEYRLVAYAPWVIQFLERGFIMKRRALIILVAGLLIAGDGLTDDAVKKDYQRLSGTWKLVSAVEDGKEVPENDVKKTRLVTDGDKFTITGDAELGTSASGTFTIDPTQKPKAVDSIQNDGPNKGKKILGIYEIIDDNNKRACWAPLGKERPTEFASKPGSGHLLQVWKRDKP
jgi:uncharacterized protein (TIGR03067 family)